MNFITVRQLLGATILAMLAACGGHDAPQDFRTISETAHNPQRAPMASGGRNAGCENCGASADGLADEYRTRMLAYSAANDSHRRPAYPQVPAAAVTVIEARAPESYGSAAEAPAR